MPNNFDCSLKIENNEVKIYVNGILHLAIKHNKLRGIQSWKDSKWWRIWRPKFYSIEYTVGEITIISEYDSIEKWISILNLLDKNRVLIR